MLSEEKQAMKYFYNLRATIDESNMLFDEDIDVKCGKETIKQITTILNLIEKQSKEIEELKITNKELTERVLRLESDKFWNNVVSKDKIKAFIKEELPDDEICSYCETFDINGIDLKRKLRSLLEEEG